MLREKCYTALKVSSGAVFIMELVRRNFNDPHCLDFVWLYLCRTRFGDKGWKINGTSVSPWCFIVSHVIWSRFVDPLIYHSHAALRMMCIPMPSAKSGRRYPTSVAVAFTLQLCG